jgi:hypothetical protein
MTNDVLSKGINDMPKAASCASQPSPLLISPPYTPVTGVEVAQSVQCMTTNWTTRVLYPVEGKDFSSSLYVQTSSEAHPASYPISIGDPFPG